METSKVFKLADNIDSQKVGQGVEGFLRSKKQMTVEGAKTPEGYFIQAKTADNGWKKLAGMGMATQVQIIETDQLITVSIGSGEWSDKVGAGVVGAVVFAPLAVTALIGANSQRKLPEEIFQFVEQFLMSGGKSVEVHSSLVNEEGVRCPSCGTSNKVGTKFCSECGTPLTAKCPSCDANVPLGTKFCPECGASMVEDCKCKKCGAELDPNQKFCPECGTKVE